MVRPFGLLSMDKYYPVYASLALLCGACSRPSATSVSEGDAKGGSAEPGALVWGGVSLEVPDDRDATCGEAATGSIGGTCHAQQPTSASDAPVGIGTVQFQSATLSGAMEIRGEGAFIEGDIQVGTLQDTVSLADGFRSAALRNPGQLWPSGVVPYTIDSSTNSTIVMAAIAHWERYTSIRFVPRIRQSDHVLFKGGSGCSSYIGRKGGMQPITLGFGCTSGNAIHEIGHALGLFHEHSRPDRDLHIKVLSQNVDPVYLSNFSKLNSNDIVQGFKYDISSIMQYPSNAFSKNGLPTLLLVNGKDFKAQRDGLSPGDQKAIQSLYANEFLKRLKSESISPMAMATAIPTDFTTRTPTPTPTPSQTPLAQVGPTPSAPSGQTSIEVGSSTAPTPIPQDIQIVGPSQGETLEANSLVQFQAWSGGFSPAPLPNLVLEWKSMDRTLPCPGSGRSWSCSLYDDGQRAVWTVYVGRGEREWRIRPAEGLPLSKIPSLFKAQ